jgi:hypothetical protein
MLMVDAADDCGTVIPVEPTAAWHRLASQPCRPCDARTTPHEPPLGGYMKGPSGQKVRATMFRTDFTNTHLMTESQRQVIINWIIDDMENTSLQDGTCTEQDVIDQRKACNEWSNETLLSEAGCIGSVDLFKAINAA